MNIKYTMDKRYYKDDELLKNEDLCQSTWFGTTSFKYFRPDHNFHIKGKTGQIYRIVGQLYNYDGSITLALQVVTDENNMFKE